MVLIRNNVTKESTYGWYPSQTDIYENPRATHGYDKECLFNFWKSGLLNEAAQEKIFTTPSPFQPKTRVKSASRSVSRTSSAKQKISRTVTPKQVDLLVKGSRPSSAARLDRPSPAVARTEAIPTPAVPHRGYHGWLPQSTIIGLVDPAQPFIAASPTLYTNPKVTSKSATPIHQAPEVNWIQDGTQISNGEVLLGAEGSGSRKSSRQTITPAEQIVNRSRVQSASSLQRKKMAAARPIHSARPLSKASNTTSTVTINLTSRSKEPAPKVHKEPSQTYWAQLKQELQEPDDLDLERPPTPINLRTPTPTDLATPSYEEQIDKYGWRAEVHGDPYNLKPITERLPYAVECVEPEVAENPYKTRVTVGETFFYNTIPRQKMTFAVHPEWQSEHFVEKRKELEKQGKLFHTRNFGFVY